jgi:large subunit ribosomal protein L4
MAQVVTIVTNGNFSALVLLGERNETVEKSARNLPNVKALHANYLNIRDLLGHQKLIIPVSALEVVAGYLGNDLEAAADFEMNQSSTAVVEEEE